MSPHKIAKLLYLKYFNTIKIVTMYLKIKNKNMKSMEKIKILTFGRYLLDPI